MVFAIRQIDHVVLSVADIERAIAFDTGVLGCEVACRVPGRDLMHLRAGSSMRDLLPLPEGAARGQNMDHVAPRVEPFDAEAIAAHLAAQGIACGAVKTRLGAEGSGPSVHFHDPEGNGVALKGPATDG